MDGGKLIWILAMAKYNLLFLFSLFFYRAKFRYIHELEAKIEHFSIKTGLSVTATGIINYEVLDRRREETFNSTCCSECQLRKQNFYQLFNWDVMLFTTGWYSVCTSFLAFSEPGCSSHSSYKRLTRTFSKGSATRTCIIWEVNQSVHNNVINGGFTK